MSSVVAPKPVLMGEGTIEDVKTPSPQNFKRYHPVRFKNQKKSQSPLFHALVSDLQQDEELEGYLLMRKNRWLRSRRQYRKRGKRRRRRNNGNRR